MKQRLQLTCEGCGRNLARVVFDEFAGTPGGLAVRANPNVNQIDYKPWGNGRIAIDRLGNDRTYTWRCKCGLTVTLRHESVLKLWNEFETNQMPFDAKRWCVAI